MQLNQKGIDLIKAFEGCCLTAYKVLKNEEYFTIGYGHYGEDVREGETITQQQANEMLEQDLQKFVNGVNSAVKVELNPNQFSALVSFAYNVGLYAFKTSTLLKYVNQKLFNLASNEFTKWIHSGGVVISGLVRRRKAEQELFDEKYVVPHPATKIYKIVEGDTLTKIADKFHTTVSHLMAINPQIKDEDKIYAGNEMKVPY